MSRFLFPAAAGSKMNPFLFHWTEGAGLPRGGVQGSSMVDPTVPSKRGGSGRAGRLEALKDPGGLTKGGRLSEGKFGSRSEKEKQKRVNFL